MTEKQTRERFACCGPEMWGETGSCPCGTWLQRHRWAVFSWLTLAGLAFLLVAAGWLLGVIAFFRSIG